MEISLKYLNYILENQSNNEKARSLKGKILLGRGLGFMKVVIDRFEGSYAVCEKEDGTMMEIEVGNLPEGAVEGDVLNIENEKISIDICETKARQKEIAELTKGMWN